MVQANVQIVTVLISAVIVEVQDSLIPQEQEIYGNR